MISFYLLLIATLTSLLGTLMTVFALGQWVYNKTQSATTYSLIGFATLAPKLIMAPLIGILIDKYPRGLLMLIGHAGAGICTITLFFLYSSDNLNVVFIIILAGISSIFNGFIDQTFVVLIPTIVEKRNFVRAQGFTKGGIGIITICVPGLAAFSLEFIGMKGVFLFDICSFIAAILLITFILRFFKFSDGRSSSKSNTSEKVVDSLLFGVRYLSKNNQLLQLLILIAVTNFCIDVVNVLFTPLVLSFSTVIDLAKVLTAAGIGTLIGSTALAIWGGPKNKLNAIYGGLSTIGFLLVISLCIFMSVKYTLIILMGIVTLLTISSVIVNSCEEVIWQTVIPTDIQGRVFSIKTIISQITLPLSFLIAGPIADYIFIPLLMNNGLLASSLGLIISVGPGRGIVLLYSICGSFIIINLVIFLFVIKLKNIPYCNSMNINSN